MLPPREEKFLTFGLFLKQKRKVEKKKTENLHRRERTKERGKREPKILFTAEFAGTSPELLEREETQGPLGYIYKRSQ